MRAILEGAAAGLAAAAAEPQDPPAPVPGGDGGGTGAHPGTHGQYRVFRRPGRCRGLALLSGRRFSWRVVVFSGQPAGGGHADPGQMVWPRPAGGAPGADAAQAGSHGSGPTSTLWIICRISPYRVGRRLFLRGFPNFQAPNLVGFTSTPITITWNLPPSWACPPPWCLACLSAWPCGGLAGTARAPNSAVPGCGFCGDHDDCWAAIHSTTDFNLQMPANALTFVTILAWLLSAGACRGSRGFREAKVMRSVSAHR